MKVVLIAPQQLRLPDYMKQEVCEMNGVPYKEVDTMEEVMGELDVLYMTRVQKERFFDEDEYDRVKDFFILDKEKLKLARPEMRILHPLPRVNEISTDVDDDPRAAYFRQVENGKFVRIASSASFSTGSTIRRRRWSWCPRMPSEESLSAATNAASPIWKAAWRASSVPPTTTPHGYRCVYCESKPK